MITSIRKKDVKLILRIVSNYDKNEMPPMKTFFHYYFKKGTFENKHCKCFSIRYDKKTVGVIGYTNRIYSRYNELEWLFLDNKYTNKGLGSEALKQLENKIKGLLIVQTGFKKAVSFYRKNGFKIYGKINNFYGKETSWFLVKKI